MSTPLTSFPLVRGKKIRVTSLDECYAIHDPTCMGFTVPPAPPPAPQPPAYCTCVAPEVNIQYIVTSGIISVALTANIDEGDEVSVKNMDGGICVLDKPCPQFQGYNIEFSFCNVNPCLWSMLTGQSTVMSADPLVADQYPIGMTMNTGAVVCDHPFALELWAGIPGATCGATPGAAKPNGYLLLPAIQPGVIGDFTIENNSISFTITGAVTKDGNGWGKGPYLTTDGLPVAGSPGNYTPSALTNPLDPKDHLYLAYSHQVIPEDTDGCHHICVDPAVPVIGGPGIDGGNVAGQP